MLLAGCGGEVPPPSDGASWPPGSGLLFELHRFGVAERTRGFDLDGACVATGDCVDNKLHRLGLANPEIQALVAESPSRVLVELAGLDPELGEEADRVTVRTYLAEPLGEARFRLAAASLRGDVPRSQAPATLRAGRLYAPPENLLELFVGAVGEDTSYRFTFRLARAALEASLSADGARLERGLIGGALTIRELASRPNPFCDVEDHDFCRRPDQSLLDLVATVEQPDIDMPPADGLERIEVSSDTRRVARCVDGRGQALPPSSEAEPWTCADHEQLRDGYSVSFGFEARRFEGTLE